MDEPAPEPGDGYGRIAIVGMSGRFPGAGDVVALWRNLRDGVESVTRFTGAHLEAAGVEPSVSGRPDYVPARAVLEGVELFDAPFFGYGPREAELIDPQQRLFLECAWEALENAGHEPERFPGVIGLFAGAGPPGYLLHQVAPGQGTGELLDGLEALLGNDKDHLCTRVAYKLNLRGPVVTVQTACSTSLVAVQLACQALLSFQCDMALAGGVSIAFPPGAGYRAREGHILSPDGHCRAFDARAQGTVPGDGAGVVVLRRLEDALEAGDAIRAIILGAAVNNDGSAKVGYTAPSIDGQSEVIELALALAGVGARSISCVEAHGTGTPLGDAIEVAALTQAFRRTTGDRGFCALGSVKTNLGHLNTAAGVTSLIKATLALENRLIPPSLHFEAADPRLGLADSPFFVSSTARPWGAGPTPRRAGVSSFAMGGTNAHVILEEAPALTALAAAEPPGPWHLLALSARTPAALEAMTERLRDHLEQRPETNLADVAYTLQVGRRAFAHRRVATCRDVADAVRALGDAPRLVTGTTDGAERPVAFLFPGQGTQYPGLAEELYRREEVFRQEVDRCARVLQPHLALDVRQVLYPDRRDEEAAARLEQTALAQPALFTLEYALARLWMSWGVKPAAMLGHSLGEFVAACLSGVFTLEDALSLVAARGRLMQSLPAGTMLAVPLAEPDLGPLLSPELSIAAVNAPSACVVSGPTPAVEAFAGALAARGISSRRLRTSHAFHSGMMDPILEPFAHQVRQVSPAPPRVPYLSGLTGTWVTEAEATSPHHWARHLRQPVRYAAGLSELAREGGHLLLEVGPGRSHASALRCLRSSPDDGGSDLELMLGALGRLWVEGVPVSACPPSAARGRRRVPLPTYPFERRRYWLGRPPPSEGPAEERPLGDVEEELRRTLGIRPLETYPGLEAGLLALCTSRLCEYLQAGGVELRHGAVLSRAELGRRLRIQPRFDRLFDAALASLAEDGLLQVTGGEVRILGNVGALEPGHALRRRLEEAHPRFGGLLELVDHCLCSYGQALSGDVDAIGVLYPGGSSRFIRECEERTAEHRHERVYNLLLQEAVRRVAAGARGRRLRILEVGGGQGMLTWPLVTTLRGHDVEYHFTDVGKVFVDDAREEAARRGLAAAMRFGLLDISRDAGEQGYAEGSFDVVVAFNVVHATRDVRRALGVLERLLVPGGTLGLVEATRVRRWDTLSWGLAEGWWHFADDLRRQESPLLPLAGWARVLAEVGFEEVEAFPRNEGARARADHGLILGRRRATARAWGRPARAAEVNGRSAPEVSSRHPRPPLRTPYVAPRNDMERRVAAVCEELLGVAPVGARDDFFELGGDSLIALRLTDRLRDELRMEIPAGAAFRGFTVERMAEALGRSPGGPPEPRASSPLVAIQPSGSRPPLFFVHPAAGVVFPYVQLSRLLGPDQPFYGLQALGLDGESEPDARVEDMARCYVEALRTVQPEGPYFIGGYSFGCLVAFEMAQQLVATGHQIGLLAIVDEPAPLPGHRPSPAEMASFLLQGVARSIWPHLHDYLYLAHASARGRTTRPRRPRLALGQYVESFLARSAMAGFIPPGSRLLALRQPAMVPMFRLFLIHVRETLAYRPRTYPGKVTLFSTDEVRRSRGREPTMGWGKLAAGGVDVHEVPGGHLSLLRPPHVQTFATRLAACVEAARLGASPGTAGR